MKEITLTELHYNNKLIKLNKPTTFYSDGSYLRKGGVRRYGNSNGKYLKMSLYDECGKEHKVYIHVLMACIFISDRPSKYHEVDHIDRNKFNNNINNLRWVTHKKNAENRDINKILNEEIFIKKFNESENPYNLTKGCVHHRVFYYGWSFEEAIKTPVTSKGTITDRKKDSYEDKKTELRKWFDRQETEVKYKTFYARVKRYGWTKEEALK